MIEPKSPRGLVPTAAFGIEDVAYNEFLATVSPSTNPDAQFALATATDKRFSEFLRLLPNTGERRRSLASLAKICGISLPEWADFWRKAQMQRALAMATNAIPGLTSDLILDAKSRHLVCERCDGFGTVLDSRSADDDKAMRPCPACKGLGTTAKAGDAHARDKLLEMTGLSGRKGGAAVTITQNFSGMGIDAAISRMDSITFDVTADDSTVHANPESES
jgi:hypothetical protein